jgi:CMP-N,N'-diacetyllegionaminic acid synthase
MATGAIAMVPARGGSKGIPNKNLVCLEGVPLLVWSIRQLASAGLSDIVVTSDSREIGSLAEAEGALWIQRPESISGDAASTESAVLHAAEEMALSLDSKILLAQATSPLRLPEHILNAIGTFEQRALDSLFSGVRIDDICLWRGQDLPKPVNYEPGNRGRRQELKPQFVENGSLYMFTLGGLRRSGSRLHGRIGVSPMPKWTIHEVDEPEDLVLCEALMKTFLGEPDR